MGDERTERSIGRRREDYLVREMVARQGQVLRVGQTIVSHMDMTSLFEIIMDQTNEILGSERSTVFLHDVKKDELWSLIATGMQGKEIRIPADHGVAGWVFQNRSAIVINDPYRDARFYTGIDEKSGFRTANILCIPLINRTQERVGVLEALNKRPGPFTDEDVELLTRVSHYIVIALENAKLYEDLKLLDKAKERVINHLSHELKTPLAILSGVLDRVSRKTAQANITDLDRSVAVGQRNVRRLLELQAKIDDVLNQRSTEEKKRVLNIIEDALDFVEELRGDERFAKDLLDILANRIESIYRVDEVRMEAILLAPFLSEVCDEACFLMKGREVEISRDFEEAVTIEMDRNILRKVCSGLLKNAIENTPDEGCVEVKAAACDQGVRIDFKDYGVGISSENQTMIFGGFFHAQDTQLYSSKEPYAFNAGGTGSDLLRMKVFSERLGFRFSFNSTRCAIIPTDFDVCTGRISNCGGVSGRAGCAASGGSTFSVLFPLSHAMV